MNENQMASHKSAQVGDREIAITRLLDAPRELAFEAWTKPEHLSKWWGPQGFTSTFQRFELHPGGTWEFVMHSPEGVDFPNTNVFTEIVRPERIVFRHAVFPHFVATAAFEEQGGKTKLTYRTVFEETEAVFEQVKTYAAPGAEQTLDRLEALLAHLASK
ncbi:SRPBCC family protein [Paenibacillus xanthanilyticus]|uniref:SRPBCC family protein n=1 Tax=Paenibacillus xanthanilyticus TaxID=1783531 RepID=A0ABV8K918_9BACL